MDSAGLTLTAWGQGLVGLAYSVFALRFVRMGYLHRPLEPARLALCLAVGFSAAWGWTGLLALQLQWPWLWLVSALFDQFRYAGWFAFLLLLLRPAQPKGTGMPWLTLVAAALAGSSVLALVMPVLPVVAAGRLADLSRWALLCLLAMPMFAMVLLEQVFRNATDDSRWNIKPLSLGLAGTFLFDAYLFSQAALFNRPDQDALSIRAVMHTLMLPLLLLSSTRRSDWLAKIRLSPKAAFHSATLLMAGLYLLFIAAVGYYVRYFGGDWGRALQLGLVFFAVVFFMLLALSGALRARLRIFLGKHFFRYRFDYRDEWLRFTRALTVRDSPQEMGQQVVRALAGMLESPAGGLWLCSKGESAFSQQACWNLAQTPDKETVDSAFCQFMRASDRVINLEEYRSFRGRYGPLLLPGWLQQLEQAWLVVPLKVGDELMGFVVLASARTRIEVNWEVNDLLKTAGQQAASCLAQMQATEALLEVRKFDSFNRMSAFVVHDLKNIVTQLSLMMKNARRLADNPEFQQDMLMTVDNALDRMRQLMLQLREGAAAPGAAFGVDLVAVVARVAAVARAHGRQLELELVDALTVYGHEDRLERIVGHVVQNAFDATDIRGRVSLRLDRFEGMARIAVTDTGQGMSQEFIRDRLFKPFQTTKQAGLGIGSYESYHYVQELGGKMHVNSEPGRGSVVTIMLALFEPQKPSDPL